MKEPNIILLVLDAVRADRLSCYGYKIKTTPIIDELSKKGTIFLKTIATAPWTVPSVASIFTGLYPSEHGATQEHPYLTDEIPTLAEILAEKGYYTIGFSTNPWFHKQSNLSKGFQEFHLFPEGKSRKRELIRKIRRFIKIGIKQNKSLPPGSSYGVVSEIINRLKGIPANQPFFLYAHFMDTHLPYQPDKKFLKKILGCNRNEKIKNIIKNPLLKDGLIHVRYNLGLEPLNEEELKLFNIAYDASLCELDDAIRNLIEYLTREKLLNSSLIIITSDHGENIGDHGLMDHQLCLYDTLLKVPLIIIGPSFPENYRYSKQVQLHQIYHTIIRAAHAEWKVKNSHTLSLQEMIKNKDGLTFTFAEYGRPDQIKNAYSRYTPTLDTRFYTRLKCVRHHDYKYIFNEIGKDELYDLRIDPKETQNLITSEKYKSILEKMKNALRKWQAELTTDLIKKSKSKTAEISENEVIRQLKGLGYM